MGADAELFEALKYRIEVNEFGARKYLNAAGQLHREEGPAVEWHSGERYWYQNGVLHRSDGPAIEWPDGSKEWYQNGLRHRIGGPAVLSSVAEYWFLHGVGYSEDEYHTALKDMGAHGDR